MLKQRIITALILAPLVVWALFGLPDEQLLWLFMAVLLAGSWEWAALAGLHSPYKKILFVISNGVMFVAAKYYLSDSVNVMIVLLSSTVLLWFLIIFWLALYDKEIIVVKFSRLSRILIGILLLTCTFISVGFLTLKFEHDRILILLMFLLIWGADVAAYFSGRKFGKNKLAPNISPGKTWEGVVGALVSSITISVIYANVMGYQFLIIIKLLVLSLVVVAVSIAGDLFESVMKRQAGLKDSGNILPGHGGVLDRIDSLIAASPVFVLGMYLLGLQE
ncbi:MAG: phosphatidate cytidylyltransferase [Gammaproteobacteria bacterium]|nr:phosphatidate cytidylyltransferase [Gammaproteobacteria bacterium]